MTVSRSKLLAMGVLCMLGCRDDNGPTISIDTDDPVLIDNTTVHLGATIEGIALSRITEYGFIWSEKENPDQNSGFLETTNVPPVSTQFSAVVEELTPGTTYYCRGFVVVDNTTRLGSIKSFTAGTLPVTITSIRPSSGHWLDTVLISGKNLSLAFPEKSTEVIFGQLIASISWIQSDTLISCIVPSHVPPGETSVFVKVVNQSASASFHLKKPEITSFAPTNASFGAIVNINGSGFNPRAERNIVRFGSVPAEVIDAEANGITVKVPESLDQSQSTVTVQLDSQTVEAPGPPFTLSEPMIANLSATSGRMSDVISISGSHFNPNLLYDSVWYDENLAETTSATGDQIQFKIPGGVYLDRTVTVHVRIGGYDLDGGTFELTNPWIQKADLPGGLFGRSGGQGFVIDGTGYAGLGLGETASSYYKDFSKYDPVNNTWTRIADFAGGRRYWTTAFVINGLAYVGGGSKVDSGTGTNDFYKYDPATDAWTRMADFPGDPVVHAAGFAVQGKGYVCLPQSSNNFWEYDPDTDTWQQKTDLTTDQLGGQKLAQGAFVLNDRAFVIAGIYSSNRLLEYDPATNSWSQLGDPPELSANLSVVTSTSTHAYFMNGYTAYEYDVDNDSWTQVEFEPIPQRTDTYFFSMDEKIYVGGGREENFNDFWECDTSLF